MAEQRFLTAIQAEFAAGPVRARGEIQNVGPGGLFLGTRSIPEQGETVELQFAAPSGESIRVSGIVWWCTPEPPPRGRRAGFGVRLLDATEPWTRLLDGLKV